MELLASLNDQQQEAVKCVEGPLLILAGAGSGKTKVLVHKVAYLLEEKGVNPGNILAITFTNKAADEMRARICHLTGDMCRGMWIGTFHAVCVRILRQEIHHMDFNGNFVIYDATDQQSLIKKCLKELDLDEKKFNPRAIGAVISNAKNKMWDPDKFGVMAGDYFEAKAADVYKLYQRKLRENNALDFDDLIMTTVNLFSKKPEVLRYYQHKFQYILVDEYQDTNHSQYRLVRLLAEQHHHLCVVGDPDQSIYGWRGADIQNILDFEEDYAHARVIRLEQNYRSTQNILDAANAVIKNNFGRKEKRLWTDHGSGPQIVYKVVEDERDEGAFIADTVYTLSGQQYFKYKDCAVLYRTHAQSRPLEDAFIRYKIPYRIFGGTKFYDRKEIKDTLAYLKVISNADDGVSLTRIINEPKRGIGDASWSKVEEAAAFRGVSSFKVLADLDQVPGLTPRALNALRGFYVMMISLMEEKDDLSVTQLVQKVWASSGYERMLEEDKSPEAEMRLENLKEFLSVTEEFDRHTEEPTLENFLATVSLTADVDSYVEEDDVLTLMTLHTAKGLEFPVIFLVGMEEGVFPHGRSLLEQEELEEERRLCYVGITRAMKNLYLTRAYRRLLWGNTQYNPESRFIGEIPSILLTDNAEGRPVENSPEAKTAYRQKDTDAQKGKSTLLSLGDKVQHAKFGTGVIVKTDGLGENMELSIAFPGNGIKTFILKYAPIKKI
jgi:DNA helicase-2/ATP-dependent DNA helicase PcrA